MKDLTKAEEQVMQILWKKEKAFVKDIMAEFPNPKPAYNTVSTIVRILETKGFVHHEAQGKSYLYFPMVKKEAYKKFSAGKLLKGYFENSAGSLLSFFIKEKQLDSHELEEIMKIIENSKSDKS